MRGPVRVYLLAALLGAAAIALPGVAVLLAAAASAYLGGLGPGLVATAIGALGPLELDRGVTVAVGGVLLSLFGEAVHRGRARGASALARSDRRFARVFRANPVPLLLTRLRDGVAIEVSESFLAMTGYARDQVIGHTTLELALYVDVAVRASVLRAAAESGHVAAIEAQIRTRGGELRDTLLTAEHVELGGEPHAVGIFVDITDRKRDEVRIRESEQRFRQLADHVREVFYLYDRGARAMLYVSPHFEAVYGRPLADAYASIGTWTDAIHPDDRARMLARAATEPDAPYTEAFRIVRPDGGVRWIESHVSPVVEADGRCVRVAGIADDVTERRRLEDQVRHTQRMESVGVLAGGIAHDFNNVLTVILSCAELMKRLPGDVDLIDDVITAVERAQLLTRQLLVFSRREVTEPRVLDVNAAVTDAEKMLRRLLGEDVVVSTKLAPDVGSIRIDAGHFVQVLMNLAVNARDAMPRGGALRIETREVTAADSAALLDGVLPPARYACIAVSDGGCGMSGDVLARIFEPFFTTKGAGKGTGMGLAVAHGIVRQSGGSIEVASAVGAGTTFTIYLPVVDAADVTPRELRLADPPRGSETVLVVEDADDLRRLTTRALRERGYHVLEASDGPGGLAIVRAHVDDLRLLVADVVMPGMDGRELVEAALRVAPGLRVLYTSGYTDDAVLRHGVAADEVAFLQKPFTPGALVRKVREVLDRAAS